MEDHASPSFRPVAFLATAATIVAALTLSLVDEKVHIIILAYATLIQPVGSVLVLFLAAWVAGRHVLKITRVPETDPYVRAFYSLALGFGLLSVLAPALGGISLLKAPFVNILMGVLILSGLPGLISTLKRPVSGGPEHRQLHSGFWEMAIFSGLVFAALFYFLSALSYPVSYDVLEYHLGSVFQSLRESSLKPQPHVFYSALPFGAEALYALGLVLENGTYYTPKLMNCGLVLAGAWGMALLIIAWGLERPWALLGALLFLLNRLVVSVGLDAFVEPAQTVFVLAALLTWTASWKRGGAAGERGQSPLVFSFVFWGFALGVKWSILGMGIVPFFVLLVPAGLYFHHTQSGRGASIKSMARPVLKWWLLGMVIVAAVFSPWMIRAFLQTGNPVFPFLSGVFPWDGWTRAQMDYYMDVNRQAAPFSVEHLGMYLHKWKDLGALWFLPALLSPFFIRERRSNLILLVFGLAGYLLWNLFLQPPARFLVPLIPVFVLLNLVTFRGLVRSTPRGVFFLFPWILLVPALLYVRLLELHNSGFLKAALFSYQQEEFLQEQLPAYYEAADFINKNLPADARLLFLYEARVFYVERPVTASTVFDRSPLVNHAAASESARDLMKRLQGAGYTHILLNEVEMNRLIRTYVPKSILIGMGIAPYFTNPDANLTAFDNLYGPYLLDPGYEKARPVIREFTRIMKTRAVFDRVDDRGLRFFIAPLAD